MSAEAMTFDVWYIDYHKTMASAATVGRAISKGASILSLAKNFWSFERNFRALISSLNSAVNSPGSCPTENLEKLISRMRDLHKGVTEVLQLALQKQYHNRTFFSSPIRSIQKRNSELEDFIEHFELSLDPSLNPAVAEALQEFERHETVDLNSLLR